MSAPTSSVPSGSRFRPAGRAAVASGAAALIAHVFLWAGLISRESGSAEAAYTRLFRAHDAGAILQALLIIPAVAALHRMAGGSSAGTHRVARGIGIGALSVMVLCLALNFLQAISDTIYAIPQGVFGVWMISAVWTLSGVLSRGLRWFGMIVGAGLVLVALFPIGYGIFVNPVMFRGVLTDATPPPGTERANEIVHLFLMVGSLMGVTPYPIWAALVGRTLLRRR